MYRKNDYAVIYINRISKVSGVNHSKRNPILKYINFLIPVKFY
jgi:hypothetical protein